MIDMVEGTSIAYSCIKKIQLGPEVKGEHVGDRRHKKEVLAKDLNMRCKATLEIMFEDIKG